MAEEKIRLYAKKGIPEAVSDSGNSMLREGLGRNGWEEITRDKYDFNKNSLLGIY